MISAAALDTPASLSFADSKAGRMIRCRLERLGGALANQRLYQKLAEDSPSLLPARLNWGTDDASGRGERPTCRGLAGPKSGPSRPLENDASPDPTIHLPRISLEPGANAQPGGLPIRASYWKKPSLLTETAVRSGLDEPLGQA
jgi:hypothetical protein